MTFNQYQHDIMEKEHALNMVLKDFWDQFSSWNTWQFWVILAVLIFPLVLLYFFMDRKRLFEIFFFGYTVHILWTYVDIFLETHNYMIHTYMLTWILPYALNLTTSFLPVGFLLLYQYCTNHRKNFYLFTIILSFIFSVILAPLEKYIGLVELRNHFHFYYVFFIDIGIAFIAYWFTLFLRKYILHHSTKHP
ncbi:hypothetical protein GCM10011391_22590 [Pullulanibacillus camelliae]|uniref:Uncharacterized protein n=1 Tax=Pullulanibacillus camelliae TaxID=1707096 RepID=A0A8J2YHT4_9BACL|nr:hypothetical protein [Pullulanibacillus camelliae]GGE43249.1 hypothetical protein GCM10011391_22590 [Pullulanibacillus camelliae]